MNSLFIELSRQSCSAERSIELFLEYSRKSCSSDLPRSFFEAKEREAYDDEGSDLARTMYRSTYSFILAYRPALVVGLLFSMKEQATVSNDQAPGRADLYKMNDFAPTVKWKTHQPGGPSPVAGGTNSYYSAMSTTVILVGAPASNTVTAFMCRGDHQCLKPCSARVIATWAGAVALACVCVVYSIVRCCCGASAVPQAAVPVASLLDVATNDGGGTAVAEEMTSSSKIISHYGSL